MLVRFLSTFRRRVGSRDPGKDKSLDKNTSDVLIKLPRKTNRTNIVVTEMLIRGGFVAPLGDAYLLIRGYRSSQRFTGTPIEVSCFVLYEIFYNVYSSPTLYSVRWILS